MDGFSFSLAEHTYLRADERGAFLFSRLPVRWLRVNEALYGVLRAIGDGDGLDEIAAADPDRDKGNLLHTLLKLTARGYLRLEAIAALRAYPTISIIIPVRDQPAELAGCLEALQRLDYPPDRREIIVVDDGSRKEVSAFITSSEVRIIRKNAPEGPAAGRNTGAAEARGDILAFLDADCVAGEGWLRQLVPFFRAAGVGIVGGYVSGYYQQSTLDRYEAAASSLNLGDRLMLEGKSRTSLYVPTANMLVTRDAFTAAGGFRAELHIGEDVDFCWRLRELDYTVLYAPYGRVAHRHRGQLGRMLSRRAAYGTSEAPLYQTHRHIKKTFPAAWGAGLAFLALSLAVLLPSFYPLLALLPLAGYDLWSKHATLTRFGMELGLAPLLYAVLRSYLSLGYYAAFHLVRYYFILLVGLGFVWTPCWWYAGVILIYASIVDAYVKGPRLAYPVFLLYYLLEHLAYQGGCFWGCLKTMYFGSYLVVFKKA